MEYTRVDLGAFQVVGVSVRTTNQGGQSQKDIGDLWGRFMSQNIGVQIPNKSSEDIYCIYTDYESDFMGVYTTILGYKVNSIQPIPAEFTAKAISASAYNLYQSSGLLPESVMKTWMAIWASGIKRKYADDFDVYPADAFSSQNPVVQTYLSV